MSLSMMENMEFLWMYWPCIKSFLIVNSVFLLIVVLQGEVVNRRNRMLYRSIRRQGPLPIENSGPKIFNADGVCPICLEHARLAVVTNCGHLFCWRCIVVVLGNYCHGARCPCCRERVRQLLPRFGPLDLAGEDVLVDDLKKEIECINELLCWRQPPRITRTEQLEEHPELACFVWFLVWTALTLLCVCLV